MRTSLAGHALPGLTCLFCLSAVVAQMPTDSGLWLLEQPGRVRFDDSSGAAVGGLFLPATADQAPRRALDGALWAARGAAGVVVRVRDGQPARVHTFPGEEIVELCTDAQSHALVVLASGRVIELAADMRTVATWPLPLRPTAVECGVGDDIWLGMQNQPVPLLGRLDRSSGRVDLYPLPASVGGVSDVLPTRSPAGVGPVFVGVALDDLVVEVDPSGGGLTLHHLPGGRGSGVQGLELGGDGVVWAWGPDAVWRLDPDSGAVIPALNRPAPVGVSVDGEDRVWVYDGNGGLRQLDPSDGAVVWQRRPSGGGLLPRLEDAAGTFLLQVLDPSGDQDGDGVVNRDELVLGSSPFDAQSNRSVDVDATLDAPVGGSLRVTLQGEPGLALLAFAPRVQAVVPQRIPGIGGELRLDLSAGPPVVVLVAVPGSFEFEVPVQPGLSGLLDVQAVHVPLTSGPAKFSDVATTRPRDRWREAVWIDLVAGGGRAYRDDLRSGGDWFGGIVPDQVGGRGMLGSFDPTLGALVGPDVWQFSSDQQLFPSTATLFGNQVVVRDGIFEFTDFVVPEGVEVRFTGSKPVQIKVRGRADIRGRIALDGLAPAGDYDATAQLVGGQVQPRPGQIGAAGGAGGASGGRGGVGCTGQGATSFHSGQRGGPVTVPGLSGYFGVPGLPGTGGLGGLPFPADGLNSSVTFSLFGAVSVMVPAGGGGGAWRGAGGPGLALRTAAGVPADLAPPTAGGAALQPLSAPVLVSSRDHYLVGGSGGGGGGSHPGNMSVQQLSFQSEPWRAGGGGAGGGGALLLAIGGELQIGAQAELSVRGGGGTEYVSTLLGPPSPGGAGSGGTLLLQVADAARIAQGGTLDVRGGASPRMRVRQFNGQFLEAEGGEGGHGLVRLETSPAPTPAALGTVLGPLALQSDFVGALTDRDVGSGGQSLLVIFQTNGASPKPAYYEIVVETGGTPVTFTDNPDPSRYNPANLPGQPLRFFVQGAEVDGAGRPSRLGAWRDFFGGPAGLAADGTTDAVRFMVLFDASVATDTRVRRISFHTEV